MVAFDQIDKLEPNKEYVPNVDSKTEFGRLNLQVSLSYDPI